MKYSTSLFCQLLQLIPKTTFARLVKETDAERHAKGFRCWDQLAAMLFCQLAQAKSLREISGGLKVCLGKLNHLGLTKAPARSTLSYANSRRPHELFGRLCNVLRSDFAHARPGKKGKFQFRHKLLSLDSSTIDLCLSLFPWAEFRQTKGAVKLHCLLDHDGYFPAFALVTDGKVGDVQVARVLNLPANSIVAMDRGYNDYALFQSWTEQGVYFVTRTKANAAYEVVEQRPVTPHSRKNGVRSDQLIRFTAYQARKACPDLLRLVVYYDEKSDREFSFLTNQFKLAPLTVAAIYRDRWEIELFFPAAAGHPVAERRSSRTSRSRPSSAPAKTPSKPRFGQHCWPSC